MRFYTIAKIGIILHTKKLIVKPYHNFIPKFPLEKWLSGSNRFSKDFGINYF